MSASPWGDPFVLASLREVVDDLGRRTALEPSRLRAALNDSLGSQAHQFRAQVDVLVVAVEEGVPQGLLAGVTQDQLRERLLERDLQPGVVDWVLASWSSALRLDLPGVGLAPTALPIGGDLSRAPSPPADPTPSVPTVLPAGRNRPAGPTSDPPPARALPATSLPPVTPSTPGRGSTSALTPKAPRSRLRPGLVAGGVGVVLVTLMLSAVALATRNGADQRTAGPADTVTTPAAVTARPPSATPSVPPTATPSVPTPAPQAALAPLTVLAHEGGDERYALETAAALVNAAKRGYAAETDVHWTKDGVGVLVHDTTPQPPMVCDRDYVIAKTSWTTLQAKCRTEASASKDRQRYGIPQFSEVTQKVAAVPGAQLFAEVKVNQNPTQVKAFYQTLKSNQMVERTVVTSFFPEELAKMREAAKVDGSKLRLMQFVRDTKLSPTDAKAAGLWAVAIRENAVDASYVKRLHAAGLKTVAWTADDPQQWARLHKAGIDYVLTNKPGGYLAWQKAR